MTTCTPARPFVPPDDPAVVADLLARLAAARHPDPQPVDTWSAGTPLSFLRGLAATWRSDYDVSAFLDRLRALPHFVTEIDGTRTHFLHARSPHSSAQPLVLTHGWPSSFLEAVPLLEHLTRPELHGGRAQDAFHVVVPSMPGFAYSDPVRRLEQLTAASISDRWRALMVSLGYDTFYASGGDIGARVTAWLAVRHADAVRGAHMSTNALARPETYGDTTPLTAAEQEWLRAMATWSQDEGAYHHLQATKPLTVAAAVSDSPLALAAWVAEKWHAWSTLDLEDHGARAVLLDLLTLYWTTGSFGSSVLHYHAHDLPPGPRPVGDESSAPVSVYASEAEIGGVPPRSLAERQFHRPRWSVLPRGGHFMATEEPALLAADLRGFAAALTAP